MSPENFSGKKLTVRSDLYSLGLTAYECLSGSDQFDPGENLEQIITRRLTTLPPTPSLETDDERRFYDDVVLRLIATDPEDRLPSAAELLEALRPWTDHAAGAPEEQRGPPQPYVGNGDYFFASYAQRDIDRVGPLMRRITLGGNNLWYDRGIPGGAEWDSMIEERIRSCSGLVLFLTETALESKFVRREVKFADAIDKPIVTLSLEPVELKYGLHMLLAQYQMLTADRVTASEIGIALGYVHHLQGFDAASVQPTTSKLN
jgi:hypothetical protein